MIAEQQSKISLTQSLLSLEVQYRKDIGQSAVKKRPQSFGRPLLTVDLLQVVSI